VRSLSEGTLQGLAGMQTYRFLTIPQFAALAGVSVYHAGETLRALERRGAIGYFGYVSLPGAGRTPKVYYVKRKGWEILRHELDDPEVSGPFAQWHVSADWTPQMYHRLRLLDLFIGLAVQIRSMPHLQIVKTGLEYRRIKQSYKRETTDYVAAEELVENKLVPDGVFALENRDTGNRGLFFVEMDMATERITTKSKHEYHQTIHFKLSQYDRYLSSGRFATSYAIYGAFRSFTLLFVTYGRERIENIRRSVSDLNAKLHNYYRFATFEDARVDFLGPVWKSRAPSDTLLYALVQKNALGG
jgi:Replication-relaxation